MALTIAVTCLVASSNYVLNELFDAETDRFHPRKKWRPAAAGMIRRPWALLEWMILGAAGMALATAVNMQALIVAMMLWLMGLAYNVPPIRLKDWPYLDVLSESANNPLRLGLGWFAVLPDRVPPLSLILAYWMGGAFIMAIKRLSEYQELSALQVAGPYRRSFEAYTENRLLTSSVFYAVLGAHFGGMFVLRYRLELVVLAPLTAGLFGYYLRLAYKPRSAVQHPERLYREGRFTLYLTAMLIAFVLLMFVEIPVLYQWFTVDPAGVTPLWRMLRRDGSGSVWRLIGWTIVAGPAFPLLVVTEPNNQTFQTFHLSLYLLWIVAAREVLRSVRSRAGQLAISALLLAIAAPSTVHYLRVKWQDVPFGVVPQDVYIVANRLRQEPHDRTVVLHRYPQGPSYLVLFSSRRTVLAWSQYTRESAALAADIDWFFQSADSAPDHGNAGLAVLARHYVTHVVATKGVDRIHPRVIACLDVVLDTHTLTLYAVRFDEGCGTARLLTSAITMSSASSSVRDGA